MTKIKEKIKSNHTNKCFRDNFTLTHPIVYKYIISNLKAFFLGGLISFVMAASATVILHSRQVQYKDGKSVETAINELYEKASDIYDENGVPITYTKLNYLESTGSQWIDTGYTFSDKNRFILKTWWTELSDENSRYLFGANSASNEVLLGRYDGYNRLGGLFVFAWDKDIVYEIDLDIKNTTNNLVLKVNGDIIRDVSGYVNGKKCYLFAVVTMYEDTPSIQNYTNSRLYYFKIYNESNLVRDYIPVLDSTKHPCMYDKVSKTCFYNQGTGEFLYG